MTSEINGSDRTLGAEWKNNKGVGNIFKNHGNEQKVKGVSKV